MPNGTGATMPAAYRRPESSFHQGENTMPHDLGAVIKSTVAHAVHAASRKMRGHEPRSKDKKLLRQSSKVDTNKVRLDVDEKKIRADVEKMLRAERVANYPWGEPEEMVRVLAMKPKAKDQDDIRRCIFRHADTLVAAAFKRADSSHTPSEIIRKDLGECLKGYNSRQLKTIIRNAVQANAPTLPELKAGWDKKAIADPETQRTRDVMKLVVEACLDRLREKNKYTPLSECLPKTDRYEILYAWRQWVVEPGKKLVESITRGGSSSPELMDLIRRLVPGYKAFDGLLVLGALYDDFARAPLFSDDATINEITRRAEELGKFSDRDLRATAEVMTLVCLAYRKAKDARNDHSKGVSGKEVNRKDEFGIDELLEQLPRQQAVEEIEKILRDSEDDEAKDSRVAVVTDLPEVQVQSATYRNDSNDLGSIELDEETHQDVMQDMKEIDELSALLLQRTVLLQPLQTDVPLIALVPRHTVVTQAPSLPAQRAVNVNRIVYEGDELGPASPLALPRAVKSDPDKAQDWAGIDEAVANLRLEELTNRVDRLLQEKREASGPELIPVGKLPRRGRQRQIDEAWATLAKATEATSNAGTAPTAAEKDARTQVATPSQHAEPTIPPRPKSSAPRARPKPPLRPVGSLVNKPTAVRQPPGVRNKP